MKKRSTTWILCILMAAAMCLPVGCSQKEEAPPAVHPITITLSIDYPPKAGPADVIDETFTLEEGSTVLDALQLYCNVMDMPVTVETTDGAVLGINGVDNDPDTRGSWVYTLNGKVGDTPENDQALQDGDALAWVYQREKTKDGAAAPAAQSDQPAAQ